MRAQTSLAALVVFTIAGLLAGCSSSGQSTEAEPPSTQSQQSGSRQPGSAGSASTGSASTVGAVKSVFVTFFDGKTGAARKIGLLQNGPTFATAIKAQAASGLAKSSSVKVIKVTVSSADRALVVYTVLLGGSPALKDQSGTAVREDGAWKVSAATFCSLLTLEGQAPAACPSSSASSATS